MERTLLCRELEDLVEQFGIVIRHESFDDPEVRPVSGLCTIKGEKILFIDYCATVGEKISVFVNCLTQLDLQNVYLKPAVRDFLSGCKPRY